MDSPNTPSFREILAVRSSRRAFIGGLAAFAASSLAPELAGGARAAAPAQNTSSLGFDSLPLKLSPQDAVAQAYQREVLIRWGDPVLPGVPAFDPVRQSAAAQARQFGFNNDYVAFLPLPRGSRNSDHGLLWVNHEYVTREIMFPKHTREADLKLRSEIEKQAHGGSLVEIRRDRGRWAVVPESTYARRITAETEIGISGPAAGHARMKTSYDPSGTRVRGMIANCSGGRTPWGTVLTAEENYQNYFAGAGAANLSDAERRNARRTQINDQYGWGAVDSRFDLAKDTNEMNRFGWIVEIDPYDPARMPVKRTALGRFSHEAANSVVAPDGRVVVYLGDDAGVRIGPNGEPLTLGEYIYRFVTAGRYDAARPEANWGLLDSGELAVARFSEHRLEWLPLVFGQGPLTPANDFHSQADVAIEARRAADLLGATPMDRPEDIESSPVNGRVYVMLTSGALRPEGKTNIANARAHDRHGHILELIPPRAAGGQLDHSAAVFDWNVFLYAGDEASGATPQKETRLSMPDNCAFDPKGRLWIASDKGNAGQDDTGWPDGLYACDTDGAGRALLKLFYAAPYGSEVCGPEFTPDGTTLFLAIQHPGEGSSFESPSTRWPDFAPGMPPRPSVIAITRTGGGAIG
jgi:secreted PhoX family phosphatase